MGSIPASQSIVLITGFSPWAFWEMNANLYRFEFYFLYSLPVNIIKPSFPHTSASQKAGMIITYSGSQ